GLDARGLLAQQAHLVHRYAQADAQLPQVGLGHLAGDGVHQPVGQLLQPVREALLFLVPDIRPWGGGPGSPPLDRGAGDARLARRPLNYACRLKLIPSNPAASVPKPREPKREMLCLAREQARFLLAASRGRVVHPLLAVALGTGCRQGEILALLW